MKDRRLSASWCRRLGRLVIVALCLVSAAAEARPRDGTIVVRPNRVVIKPPRGAFIAPLPAVTAAPVLAAPVAAVVPAPRLLAPRRLAIVPATPLVAPLVTQVVHETPVAPAPRVAIPAPVPAAAPVPAQAPVPVAPVPAAVAPAVPQAVPAPAPAAAPSPPSVIVQPPIEILPTP